MRAILRFLRTFTATTKGMVCAASLLVVIICILLSLAQKSTQQQRLPNIRVTDQEIADLANELRKSDRNKARSNQIQLDYQGHTSTRDTADNAKSKFFRSVDQSLFSGDGTYAKLFQLYDNFEFETGVSEIETAQERTEIKSFVDAVVKTRPMQLLFQFLQRKEHPYARSENQFRQWLLQLWFASYSRARGNIDTSGFEHVFMGEAKNGEISGLHNWVRLYYLEKNSSPGFDYKGFLVKRFNIFGAIKFSIGNFMKRSGSFFIGTSPEYDMSIYTLCFLFRRGVTTCNFEFDGCPIAITSFDLIQQKRVFIGSMYRVLVELLKRVEETIVEM
uniref:Endoribonuclease n=1 Tax=Ditylenchus dipsaci TaxID=166011 RepID=A0A915DAP1_9BILA